LKILLIGLGILAGAIIITWLVFAFWRVRSTMQRRAAGEPFVEELTTGSFPAISVRDAKDRIWRVKWGNLVWAAGYFVEINYFVPSGRVEGANELQRARQCVAEDGVFRGAARQAESPARCRYGRGACS
jgi:hypothetical protein